MKRFLIIPAVLTALYCGHDAVQNRNEDTGTSDPQNGTTHFTMVFASCSDQDRPQPLWEPILQTKPDLFVWGGDNVYADTEDMAKMEADYNKVWANATYAEMANATKVIGVWDDHDYGLNDAGEEWEHKAMAQQLLLDFLKVPQDSPRRGQEGTYYSETISIEKGSIKLIMLDTRYFRTALRKSDDPNRRYDPWPEDHDGAMLGEAQWDWLEKELQDSSTDFTIIVSSIQFLSKEHGWEKWYNFPAEVTRMRALLKTAQANNIFFLSGDRHMAEISVDQNAGLSYPLVDFTSSGMTHTWPTTPTEGNEYRVSNVVKHLNYSVLLFNFEAMEVTFQIRGEEGFLYEEFVQSY